MTLSDTPPITTLLFDFGGVLVRTQSRQTRLRWDTRLGQLPGTGERLLLESTHSRATQRGEIAEAVHWEWVRQQLGLTPLGLAHFRHDFFADDLATPIIPWLAKLHTHYRIGLLSNFWGSVRDWLGELGVLDCFDDVVFSAEVGFAKPDPRIYTLALSRLACQPRQALFIDDFEHNLAPARQLGMHTLLADARGEWVETLVNLYSSNNKIGS
ncbi:MAG TPA: HAD family phosphatase [Anaerolineales bacterium]|nr:HAD family phosphatase [Anaerolineales bacterium]